MGLVTARAGGAVSGSCGGGRYDGMSLPRGRGSGQTAWISGGVQPVSASTRAAPRGTDISETCWTPSCIAVVSLHEQRTNVHCGGQQTAGNNDRGG